ncbi:MAG: transcription antitermination factor NusB [Epsilonproteobacteria bacterium]|nr:transcription antitermination factor NusB [Campylobacterota bacterium]
MATRHQSRESVISLLYAKDIGNENIEKFMDEIFEDKKIRNKQKEFAQSLFEGVVANLEEIDSEINQYLKEYKLDSIGNIERAILRLGAYEILKTDLDNAVIINESIELSKSLASDTAPKFINGVLDAVKKSK